MSADPGAGVHRHAADHRVRSQEPQDAARQTERDHKALWLAESGSLDGRFLRVAQEVFSRLRYSGKRNFTNPADKLDNAVG